MSKQDAYSPRTAADLERKYNFGQTFAKVFGLVDDAVRTAEEAKTAYEGLDQEQIFNLLTNYGKAEGIYRDDNGDVYVNASYIQSGKLSAAYIDTEGLVIQSANVEGLEALIASYEDAVEQYENQVAGFRTDVNGFSGVVSGYRTDVQGYADEVSRLNASVAAYQGEVERYAAQVSTFNQTVDGFRTTVQGYDESVLGYTEELASLNAQIKTYTSAVYSYEDNVKEYAAQVSAFQQTVAGFDTTVIGYKETVDGYTAEYSAVIQRADSLTAQVGDLETGMSQTLRLADDGVTITNAEGSTLEIDGGQIAAESITATKIDVDGLVVQELHSEVSEYNYVDISGATISMYSGYIRDNDYGDMTFYAGSDLELEGAGSVWINGGTYYDSYCSVMINEAGVRFYMPNGRYFELANGAFCYRTSSGSLISQAVFN